MSDIFISLNSANSLSLQEILHNCANIQSYENLTIEDLNDVYVTGPKNTVSLTSNNSSSNTNKSSTTLKCNDNNIMEDTGRISLAYENLRTIPGGMAEKFAYHTTFLDLSYNAFQNLTFLSFFENLHTLILDRNINLNVDTLPYLPNLQILWINNCNITDLADWLQRIKRQCPALEHLSIMGNPGIKRITINCSPLQSQHLTSTNESSSYRDYVLSILPNLKYLDGMLCKPLSDLENSHRVAKAQVSSCASMGIETTTTSSNKCSNESQKSSIKFCFKELFKFKQKKTTLYNSSSTN